jgi:hypothetical protein
MITLYDPIRDQHTMSKLKHERSTMRVDSARNAIRLRSLKYTQAHTTPNNYGGPLAASALFYRFKVIKDKR